MKRLVCFAAVLLSLVSCKSLKEEFEPVFTSEYDNPAPYKVWTAEEVREKYGEFITIAELAGMYVTGEPMDIKDKLVVSGIISTTDQPGNFYKSFYIQDETGGLEIKAGKNGLYNDFQPGQRVYVVLNGLTLGMYGYKTGNYGGMGMIQIGGSRNKYDDGTNADKYETSYIENSIVIDTHILRGAVEGELVPYVLTSGMLPNAKTDTQRTNKYVGSLVTLDGLKYANETFVLLYLDSSKDKESYTNRVFLSDTNGAFGKDLTHGIKTWAMSKSLMTEYLCAGLWDTCKVGSGNNFTGKTLADYKGDGTYPGVEKAAYSVSQYFTMNGKEIQIRTSGYCKFSDKAIPAEVLSGAKTISVTGVLTLYQGSIQLTVNNISDFVVDGKRLE